MGNIPEIDTSQDSIFTSSPTADQIASSKSLHHQPGIFVMERYVRNLIVRGRG